MLLRAVPARRDERDETKWHLAEPVSFDVRQVESAVLRFIDGTSEAVPHSAFPAGVAVNVLFVSRGS
jgi:hypothetical protein